MRDRGGKAGERLAYGRGSVTLAESSGLEHLVRTRGFFREHPPAATMVEVQKLMDANMLIEIEADAEL